MNGKIGVGGGECEGMQRDGSMRKMVTPTEDEGKMGKRREEKERGKCCAGISNSNSLQSFYLISRSL